MTLCKDGYVRTGQLDVKKWSTDFFLEINSGHASSYVRLQCGELNIHILVDPNDKMC